MWGAMPVPMCADADCSGKLPGLVPMWLLALPLICVYCWPLNPPLPNVENWLDWEGIYIGPVPIGCCCGIPCMCDIGCGIGVCDNCCDWYIGCDCIICCPCCIGDACGRKL